ncbi:MAG: peptidase M24 [Pseudorhodobacter sp. PARRP1]|nr:MAG: peptidase M24 [Pseudorhodobacter sp. PARRP1]
MIKPLIFSLALAFPAGAFELALPVDCQLGKTCYIQQYADHDARAGAQDFTCGTLSYDGHDGTDFALPTRAAMRVGVNVLAAAAGTVLNSRDGVADFAAFPPGQDCGNGVLVQHDDGWQTQYCHMKQGSVRVSSGDAVAQGQILGQVGQSGNAAFPHLHLSVRHNADKIDPFGPEVPLGGAHLSCGAAGADLWSDALPYQPSGMLAVGISAEIPDYAAIKAGLASPDLPEDAPALVVWGFMFGLHAGDAVLFRLTGPAGEVLTERSVIEKPQAQAFRAMGRKLKAATWPAGRYQGAVILQRRGVELGRQSIEIGVGP